MDRASYSNLDAALIRQIQHGKGSVFWLFKKSKYLALLAEPYRTENAWCGRMTAKQVIELRLHALQEAELIVWNGCHWRVA